MEAPVISCLRPAIVLLGLLTLLTGVVYPLAVTGLAQTLLPHQARGSLLSDPRGPIGSDLIGQPFHSPGYFWGRPSATPRHPYDAALSGASNLAPSNPSLRSAVVLRLEALRAADPSARNTPVPVDLVTASASGLDPHVSQAAALFQVERVARARGLPSDAVRALVATHIETPAFGVLGEPRVNVLRLNLALDAMSARASGTPTQGQEHGGTGR